MIKFILGLYFLIKIMKRTKHYMFIQNI